MSEAPDKMTEKEEALEIYKLTLNQRSTMFRFYIGVLGFYFAGIFFIVDKVISEDCSNKSLLFLTLLAILGVIATRVSYKFELAAEQGHCLIDKMRKKYKFPPGEGKDDSTGKEERAGSYYETCNSDSRKKQ